MAGLLIAVAVPILIVLFILSIPFVLPFVAIAEKRTAKRKEAAVKTWPCGWCVAPLGAEAQARADALFAAHAREAFARLAGRGRMVRTLHACCPRCDAGHRYDEAAGRFMLLDPEEFRSMFGDTLRDAVPPATATMAWPWLAPLARMHRVALTRDSVCLADDVEAPHAGMVGVPAAMDVAAIAEALLRSPWLAYVGSNATWWCQAGPVTLIFGLRTAQPFVERVGADAATVTIVDNLHLHYADQRDAAELRRSIERHGIEQPDRGGTTPSRDD